MTQQPGVLMQAFHWYVPADGEHWNRLAAEAQQLADAGFGGLWLPPSGKGIGGGEDVGYGVYDLYDLGEFDQKGSVRTKYGTREQYLAAVEALQRAGLLVLADVVMNHRMGGDALETAKATPYLDEDRQHPSGEMREIQAWTHFQFPGRKGAYSDFEWHWHHFDAVDYDHAAPDEKGRVYLFEGKTFDDFVELEKGNFAYLMGCDHDFQNPEVMDELVRWGKWLLDTTGVDGFRLDAVKHISSWAFTQWLDEMERYAGCRLPVVGEYWTPKLETLQWFLDAVGGRMTLFDVPLHYHFYEASRAGGEYDMSKLLEGTLMQERPACAVTFVDNHDSQPLQALESAVESWFKPLAYAVILLRRQGFPCVFHPDYFGAAYEDVVLPSHREVLDKLLRARREFAYGGQRDYFDHPDLIGWTRLGEPAHPKAMAVVLSDRDGGTKTMDVGRPNTVFHDALGHVGESVTTDAEGRGAFACPGGSVSVWVEG